MITEQKRAPMTLARIEAVANSPTGFETITPQSARELLAEMRGALASQPEAPDTEAAAALQQNAEWVAQCEATGRHPDMREAPKGQAGRSPLPAREHARRRGSLDGADAQALEGALSQAERELAAAHARIAELEELVDACSANFDAMVEMRDERDAASARAEELTEKCYKSAQLLLEANARIAELEHQLKFHYSKDVDAMKAQMEAANARADAAEQAIDCLRQNANNAVERADAAERAHEQEATSLHKRLDDALAKAAANANLARVRAVRDKIRVATPSSTAVLDELDAALADQPEAPKGPATHSVVDRMKALETHTSEHGMGPAAEAKLTPEERAETFCEEWLARCADLAACQRDLAATNARAEELTEKCYKSAQLLLEANARIAELEQQKQDEFNRTQSLRESLNIKEARCCELYGNLDAANARADAAERRYAAAEQNVSWVRTERDLLAQKLDAAQQSLDDNYGDLKVTRQALDESYRERDKLASQLKDVRLDHEDTIRKWEESAQEVERLTARVTELEDIITGERARWEAIMFSESNVCTLEERQVLEASKELPIVTRCSIAYVPPSGVAELGRLLHAELANRAAKAKRGDK